MARAFTSSVTKLSCALAILCLGVSLSRAEPAKNYNKARLAEFEVGIFCVNRDGATTSESPDTIIGTTEHIAHTPDLVEKTQTIPAIDHLYFGIFAREKFETGPYTVTVTHPPLGYPARTSESWQSDMSAVEKTMDAYYLGLSDGNPVGRWTFTGMRGSAVLFRVEFDVVPQDDRPDPCAYVPIS